MNALNASLILLKSKRDSSSHHDTQMLCNKYRGVCLEINLDLFRGIEIQIAEINRGAI